MSLSNKILENIRKTGTLNESAVKSFFVTNKSNSNYFIGKINSIFKKHDFNSYPEYKWDVNLGMKRNRHSDECKYGVWVFLRNEWRWSWVNTFETNYSAIHCLIEHFNKTEFGLSQPLTYYNLENNFIKECNRLLLYIYNNTSEVFGFGGPTDISVTLQIITANTWYKSKFSELAFIREFNTTNEKVFVPKNRGNGDDYMNGIDFLIGDITFQHKKDKVEFVEDSCILYSSNLHKSKHEKVNRFVYEFGESIYLFDTTNIYDPSIVEYSDRMVIPNDRLLGVFDVTADHLVSICRKIFKFCINNGFTFEMFDSEEPYIDLDEKDRSVIIGFNGVDLDPISTELTKCLDHLMFLTNSDAKLSEYSPSPMT